VHICPWTFTTIYPHQRDTARTLGPSHMPRRSRSTHLETRTARLKLAVRKKPYTARVAPGVRLGYRRNATAGTWSVIAADGRGGNWMKAFGRADDFEEANDNLILTFWQAQDKARVLARGSKDSGDDDKPVTVSQALERYEADLKTRNADPRNVERVRAHLPHTLAAKTVALLSMRELRHWRDGLIKKGLAPATVKRTGKAFKAALNLVADQDTRLTNRSAWQVGLASLPDAESSRNVILPDDVVLRIIESAYEEGPQFGLFVETAAVTGARVSQLARLEVRDLQGDRPDPRLIMPSAKKGRRQTRIDRRPVPIPDSLAFKLAPGDPGRDGSGPLLLRSNGEPWRHSNHSRLFAKAVSRAGLDPTEVTIYALRHSSIVRQLLGAVPIRVVATTHDTSVAMIEKTYSRYITDHSDVLSRAAMLDPARPVSNNVLSGQPPSR
jgi:integrase